MEKLAEENRGFRFLVGEYQRQIEELEAESRKKGERILQLQERNRRAVVTTPGGCMMVKFDFVHIFIQ